MIKIIKYQHQSLIQILDKILLIYYITLSLSIRLKSKKMMLHLVIISWIHPQSYLQTHIHK
ncbi:hypothetical protein HZS_3796 [Henneguya salminicola]|nr:hypothetical protein HZS_3796 [Henneguya salminicola]